MAIFEATGQHRKIQKKGRFIGEGNLLYTIRHLSYAYLVPYYASSSGQNITLTFSQLSSAIMVLYNASFSSQKLTLTFFQLCSAIMVPYNASFSSQNMRGRERRSIATDVIVEFLFFTGKTIMPLECIIARVPQWDYHYPLSFS